MKDNNAKNRIPATKETVLAEMEVCTHMVWYMSQDAYGIVGDSVMWDINQGLIALEHAHKMLKEKRK